MEKLKDITLINDQCKHHQESYWPSQFFPTRVLLPGVLANRVRLSLAQKQKQKKFSLWSQDGEVGAQALEYALWGKALRGRFAGWAEEGGLELSRGRLTGAHRTAAAILAWGAAWSSSAHGSRASHVQSSSVQEHYSVRCPASTHGTLQASETRLSPKEQVKPYYLDLLVTNPFSVLSRSSFLGDTKVEARGGDGLSSGTVFCCVWV